MNQYLVFPYGKVITAPSYLAARRLADEQWGGITATTVLRLETTGCQG